MNTRTVDKIAETMIPISRHTLLGQSREDGREQPVARCRHWYLAHEERPAVESANRRQDHGDGDRGCPPGSPEYLGRIGERRDRLHQLLARHDPHDRDSPEHIEKHCDRDTEDGRARDRSLRVFHVAGRDGRRFESKIGKHRQRCQGCRRSQQGLAAGVELTEMRRIDVEQTNDRDRPERYHFRIGHKLGKEAGRLDAAHIDEHHSPDAPPASAPSP